VVLFDKFRKQLKPTFTPSQIDSIEQAFIFAANAHREQTRFSGEPYITHPLAVAGILAEMRMDPETLMAALLHDVVEDTSVDKTVIEEKFGQVVAELVDGVSKLAKLPFENKAEVQAENFRKMLLATAKDIRVILIKLADRLHNMSTLSSLRLEKRERIAKETMEIYVPLAKRLGMYNFYVELENLCFQTVHPQRYKIIEKAVSISRGRYQGVVDLIKDSIEKELIKQPFAYLSVSGREKHIYGIYDKMRRKRLSLDSIMDVFGFRITVDSIEDCYRALGFIHNFYKPLAGRFKDYIAIPKTNGYQSLHTTLLGPYGTPIEIQIRTREMDKIAASGVAAHWIYKSSNMNQLPDPSTQTWLKDIIDLQQRSNSLEFIEHIKTDLSSSSTYVFTPEGEIVQLPHHATVIDFAYAVHSDIGNHCVAAKVNRHFMPLNTALHSGNSVEIVFAENAVPNPAWLDFVITAKARSHIRDFLRKQHHEQARKAGKQLLDQALRSMAIEPSSLLIENVNQALLALHITSLDDLHHAIGIGETNPFLTAQRLLNHSEQATLTFIVANNVSIQGADNLSIQFPSCCYPIPHDDIIGVVNPGKGITVHSAQCHHVSLAKFHTEKFLALVWAADIDDFFTTELRALIRNETGVLAKIVTQLSEMDVNIQDVKFLSKNTQEGKVKFIFSVKNRQELAHIMQHLRTNTDILRLTRKSNARGTQLY
jgi:guanosine-3',5'-bis(diphosphate) 3'-pyrophosphohydrolase